MSEDGEQEGRSKLPVRSEAALESRCLEKEWYVCERKDLLHRDAGG